MLVGRDHELAALDAALAEAAAGRGCVVLVSGPAGIGKSRLADEASGRAGTLGLAVARAHAVDDPGAPPLWPWLRLIRGWAGTDALPALEPGDAAARFTQFVAVADVLTERANTQPLLVILEDLHWADTSSLELLRHVAAGIGSTSVAVLVTHRDTPPVPALAELAGGATTRTIPLGGLSAAEVAAWLPELIGRADPALAAAVHEGAGGNPLLVRLAAQDLSGAGAGELDPGVPRPALRGLAAARMAVLDVTTRRVVEAAAVVGERIDATMLATMTGRDAVDEQLDAALVAGVLRIGPDGLAFQHALVRDAIRAQAPDQPALHRRAALALAVLPRVPAGVVASHWERAGELDECLGWALRADDEARAALGFEEALRFAQLAARCSDGDPEVLVRLAEAQFLAGALDDSLDTCLRAADAASAAGRPELVARAGLVIVGVGNPPTNRAIASICERALRELPPDERSLRARLLAQVAIGVAETEGGPRPGVLALEALDEADRSGDPRAIVQALAARHLAISVPFTVVERLELGRRAIEVGGALGQTMPALWGHLWRADASLQLGNLAEFDHELGEIDRVARTRNSVLARWHHHRWSATRSVLKGEFDEARSMDDAAFTLARRIGDQSLLGMTYAFRTQLAILRGDVGENPTGWEDALRASPPMPLIRIALPTQLAVAGRMDEARVGFEEFRELPQRFPVGVRWTATVAQIGRCAILLGDAEVAASVHGLLLDTATYYSGDGSGAVFSHGSNAGMLGELALTFGEPVLALEHFGTALAMNVRVGARPFVALSRLGRAQALSALDRDPGEVSALREGLLAEFARLDMPGPLRAAEQLATSVSPLSPREAEIASLVAEALSNKEIAERLVLSERTVESHVRSILTKLGFTTRTEIATWQVRVGR